MPWNDADRGMHNAAIIPTWPVMITLLTILVVLSMFATLGTLFAGMLGMARGTGSPQRANKLMQLRVVMQGVTLLLFALLLTLLHR